MNNATSPTDPPSRKPGEGPTDHSHVATRLTDAELRRLLAWSAGGVVFSGLGWLVWHAAILLWVGGAAALALQVTATMVAARAAVASGDEEPRRRRPRAKPRAKPAPETKPARATRPWYDELIAFLFGHGADSGEEDSTPDKPARDPEGVITIPRACPPPYDIALHRAFFRRIVEAEFRELSPGLVWPDLCALQGALSTRLRQFQRFVNWEPVPSEDISQHDRGPHSPWHHLSSLDAASYRRGDTNARFAHRAFAPLAFLELNARVDVDAAERAVLEEDLLRLYTVGFGRVLTPPALLSAVEPLRVRVGGVEAIAMCDDARLAMRATGNGDAADRCRWEWRARARASQGAYGWPGEVLAIVEGLIDYWYVQRAVSEDMTWAEELVRLEGGSVSAALAMRDAKGKFRFADALYEVCRVSQGVEVPPPLAGTPLPPSLAASVGAATPSPTTAATVA